MTITRTVSLGDKYGPYELLITNAPANIIRETIEKVQSTIEDYETEHLADELTKQGFEATLEAVAEETYIF